MVLYFIRHGITTANVDGILSGTTDVSLAPDAYDALAELKAKGIYPSVEGKRLITSGMTRTEQTFYALFGELTHERMDSFREISFGEFEMCKADDVFKDERYIRWINDETGLVSCPGGESFYDAINGRLLFALDELIKAGQDAVIICHGAVIAAIMWYWFRADKKRLEWIPGQGRGYSILIADGIPVSWQEI
ncbi:MAG: histidine phosphatase family protein [Clostridia bacterium]|nr:histidine phosphatase family protein [Clostridia bacterium]